MSAESLLCLGQELERIDQAAPGMIPARKRLAADRGAISERNDRLQVELELAALASACRARS